MSLSIKKIPGNQFRFSWEDGGKSIQWVVNGDDVDTSILLDILDTTRPVMPDLPPTIPLYPAGIPIGMPYVVASNNPNWSSIEVTHNTGAEAADRAARDEEMRLRNMGSALASGVGLPADAIPVVDSDRNDLPEPNWRA